MNIVLRIGGSVIASPLNPWLILEYSKILEKLSLKGFKLLIVTGGGEFARILIENAKIMNMSQESQDRVAIQASRVVAQLLAEALKPTASVTIPRRIGEASKLLKKHNIVVMGGIKPGMTTDTVAVSATVKLGFDVLIKATNRDGIYDKDPSRYPDASKLDSLNFKELKDMFGRIHYEAGLKTIIDPKAARLIAKHRVKTIVLNGFKPENIELAIKGVKIGTLIYG
ncbi:UMP kinase [Candidatus Bathyarchaeota archaeon]|nr:UMP kinase [Candidatus Bathyarchaeota archaeon]MBS7612700.1 UMP kinase [Candidatus Bathyarchaeota archaeon]MBS7618208.1 UMP kinase [Candidatus Bathyarchaeota archaeon]